MSGWESPALGAGDPVMVERVNIDISPLPVFTGLLLKFQVVGSLSIHCFKICDILIKCGRSVHNFISWLLGTSRGI